MAAAVQLAAFANTKAILQKSGPFSVGLLVDIRPVLLQRSPSSSTARAKGNDLLVLFGSNYVELKCFDLVSVCRS